MFETKKIVITGPPGAGKSTLIETLRQKWGCMVQCVPEAPTLLVTSLGMMPGAKESAFGPTKDFGILIYRQQIILETASEKIAKMTGKKFLLLDKGRLDAAVHFLRLGSTLKEFERETETTVEKEYHRYDVVLFMSLPAREVYDAIRGNNPARCEDYLAAKRAESVYYDVWCRHPGFACMRNDGSWQDVVNSACEILKSFIWF